MQSAARAAFSLAAIATVRRKSEAMPETLLFSAAVAFQSARRIGLLPDGHRARRLHGHSFVARVRAAIAPGWAGFGGAEAAELRERLERCVAPLDYQLLNEHLEEPTDENLARWIKARLEIPAVERPASRARWSKASIWTATNARTCGAATGSRRAPAAQRGAGSQMRAHARPRLRGEPACPDRARTPRPLRR